MSSDTKHGARRPRIGMTVNYIGPEEAKCPSSTGSFYLNRSYVEAIQRAGGIPVPLLYLEDQDLDVLLDSLDGLCLTGGKDIDPSHFGEEPHPTAERISPARTRSEIHLAQQAVERDIPMLGICLGHQTINVALGGDMYQDLPSQFPGTMPHKNTEADRGVKTHEIRLLPGTRLREILGSDRLQVNSVHHQAVRRVADGLVVSAEAPDGVVEGLERPGSSFLVCVQWHPEDLSHREEQRRLLETFVEACREYRRARRAGSSLGPLPQAAHSTGS